MASNRLRLLPTALLVLFFQHPALADMPYTPSITLTTTQQGHPLIYVLESSNPSFPHGSLRSLNPSSTLSTGDLPFNVVSSGLPFLQQDTSLAWTASLDDHGNIDVVAGQCTSGAASATVWRFIPDVRSTTGNGQWSQRSINTDHFQGNNSQASINYLASSIAFSPMKDSDASIYTFGGMCPQSGSSQGDWVSAATYSNQVVILEPDSASEYDFKLGTSRGQPIAEAGFSVTPLQATYSNTSEGTPSDQRIFLLLGGHTQNAFINMSQVALFSLPQASWTFLPIDAVDDSTDLMHRRAQPTQVEPRSGHTALLTSDGSKVIMYGGWVGDISSAATPQLAILDVGAGYGGSGDWSWADVPAQPSLTDGAAGLYGHGASMLDGDVMMIFDGYEIPTGGSKITRSAGTASTQNLFYNVSANQWISSYNQTTALSGMSADSPAGPLSTTSQKVGLATGLPLGLLAIGLVALAAWILSKRFRRQRESDDQILREKEIQDLDATANPYNDDVFGYSPVHERGTDEWAAGVWDGRTRPSYQQDVVPGIWRGDSIREAERTGLDLDVPSPQRGLRRSMGGRGYQSSPRYGEHRGNRGSGTIHPIEERDEDENELITAEPESEDPFQDPQTQVAHSSSRALPPVPARSNVEAPLSPAEKRAQDKHGWVQDWAAATSNRSNLGRVSPTKSDRTLSSLSERSMRSELSMVSSASGREIAASNRRQHGRSLRILPAAFNPFAGSDSGSPTHDRSPEGRRTPTSATTLAADADSFTTAQSTFATLRAESDALLGPTRPGQAQALDLLEPDLEPTFTRSGGHRAPSTKVGSWVGSVKRAINSAGRSASLTMTSARPTDLTSGPDGLGGLMVYETRDSAASSPTKKGGVSALAAHGQLHAAQAATDEGWAPRRSASDGASLWSAKRGAKDWAAAPHQRTSSLATEARPGWRGGLIGSDSTSPGGPTPGSSRPLTSSGLTSTGEGDDEGDWDVEAAVEERSVQVMFTVPKERLRVVNAEVDASSVSDVGQGEYEHDADTGHTGNRVIPREAL